MDNEQTEAESIAFRISAARFDRQAQWRDFAVLYRSNQQARAIEQALRDLRIPYTIAGGQSFFDKPEIRDILAYLRLIANDDDDPAFVRAATTPRRGIGQTTLQALGEFAAQRHQSLFAAVFDIAMTDILPARQRDPLLSFARFIQRLQQRAGRNVTVDQPVQSSLLQGHDLQDPSADRLFDTLSHHVAEDSAARILDDLLHSIQYERHLYDLYDEKPAQSRWENVLELVGWLKRKAADDELSLLDLVQHVALVSMLERNEEDDPDAVRLSTLHASKGLEYPHVYLVGVEEGLLPHMGRDEDLDTEASDGLRIQRIQEERRLMYVGITRARFSLHVSWCKRRRKAREDVIRERSRFIEEMGFPAEGLADSPGTPAITPAERLGRLKALLNKGNS